MGTMLRTHTSLLLIVLTCAGLLAVYTGRHVDITHTNSVNAVIGDRSFIDAFGSEPGEAVSEQLRIATHLRYVERILREKSTGHLSGVQRRNRAHFLDLLAQYRQAGDFPYNDGHPDARRPTFIDERGNICAVGYLVEQSAGRTAAEAINGRYKYAYISQIDDPIFNRWMERSGFTRRELAMIQPAYQGPPPGEEPRIVNQNHIDTPYGLASGLLWSANIIYYTNSPADPWLLSNPKAIHWSGLLAGAGTMTIGALNLDNRRNARITCGVIGPCPDLVYTNHARTTLSAINMGMGAYTLGRSLFHLISNNEWEQPETQKGVDVRADRIRTGILAGYRTTPALRLDIRF